MTPLLLANDWCNKPLAWVLPVVVLPVVVLPVDMMH
jgi:hypothetical protein